MWNLIVAGSVALVSYMNWPRQAFLIPFGLASPFDLREEAVEVVFLQSGSWQYWIGAVNYLSLALKMH